MIATRVRMACATGGVTTADPSPEPLDVDPVRHLEHLRHVVADEDDRQAALAQVAG